MKIQMQDTCSLYESVWVDPAVERLPARLALLLLLAAAVASEPERAARDHKSECSLARRHHWRRLQEDAHSLRLCHLHRHLHVYYNLFLTWHNCLACPILNHSCHIVFCKGWCSRRWRGGWHSEHSRDRLGAAAAVAAVRVVHLGHSTQHPHRADSSIYATRLDRLRRTRRHGLVLYIQRGPRQPSPTPSSIFILVLFSVFFYSIFCSIFTQLDRRSFGEINNPGRKWSVRKLFRIILR